MFVIVLMPEIAGHLRSPANEFNPMDTVGQIAQQVRVC
jgi:hypothetical protein